MPKPILFLKSHVDGYTRTTKSGKVVQVKAHDRNDLPHSPTDPAERVKLLGEMGIYGVHHDSPLGRSYIGPWGRGNPRIKSYKAGKHPPEWGEAPQGATEAVSYNYGKGPVTVWTKRARGGEQTWDPDHPLGPRWNSRTEPHYVAWREHLKKFGDTE